MYEVSPLESEIFIFMTVSSEMFTKIACLLSVPAIIRAVKCLLYVFD
jgi:hypothetical protein